MRTFDLKNLAAITASGLVAILGPTGAVSAQSEQEYEKQERMSAKQQEKANKQHAEAELERVRMESRGVPAASESIRNWKH